MIPTPSNKRLPLGNSEGEETDCGGAGGEDGAGGFCGGGAGGYHVVDYCHVEAAEFFGVLHGEEAADVSPALFGRAACLRSVGAHGPEVVADGNSRGVAQAHGYPLALVVAPAHLFAPVHGHRNEHVNLAAKVRNIRQKFSPVCAAQPAGESRTVVVLRRANQGGVSRVTPVVEPCAANEEGRPVAQTFLHGVAACGERREAVDMRAGEIEKTVEAHLRAALALREREHGAADHTGPRQQQITHHEKDFSHFHVTNLADIC